MMKRYVIVLVVFAFLEISLALYLTYFREHFWNAIALKQSQEIITQLGIFTGVALVICFVSGFSGYLVNLTAIAWRKTLDEKFRGLYEQYNEKCSKLENLSQRWQMDAMDYPDLCLALGYGTTKALLYIVVFSVSLLLSFSWLFLLALIGYSIVGSIVARKIAYPLISMNYQQQKAEATYRNNLSIDNFSDCIRIMLGLAKKQKHLTYFQQLYGQIGVVLPIILIAPLYFTTGMTLGALMRFNSIGGTLLDNTSYPINSFASINRLLSCRKRLKEARII